MPLAGTRPRVGGSGQGKAAAAPAFTGEQGGLGNWGAVSRVLVETGGNDGLFPGCWKVTGSSVMQNTKTSGRPVHWFYLRPGNRPRGRENREILHTMSLAGLSVLTSKGGK